MASRSRWSESGGSDWGLRRLDKLKEAIDRSSEDYDYVHFDPPPLLLSADSELLIELLGQVFLVVEAGGVTRGEITRAKRPLEKIDPPAVGLFVNKLALFQGAGYLEELIVETVTRSRYERFMSLPQWRLRWELLRLRLSGFKLWSGGRSRRS